MRLLYFKQCLEYGLNNVFNSLFQLIIRGSGWKQNNGPPAKLLYFPSRHEMMLGFYRSWHHVKNVW